MSEILNKAYNPEWFRKEGHKLVDLLADYLTECRSNPDQKTINWREPDDLLADWKNFFEDENFEIEDFFKKVIDDGIHIHNPKFIGHQVTPSLPIAGLSDFLATQINNAMAIYEMGPAPTVMEKIVIDWISKKAGYRNGDGVLTSGGSLGNLTALLAARQAKTSYNIWEDGVKENDKPVFMVSEQSHYSNARAVKIMGLGETGILKLPVNSKMQIDVTKIEEHFLKAREEGKNIIGFIANACSTSTGTYDDLESIADFCEKYDIWLHVDAAHGGPAIFSDKYKYLVKGIERADSIVIDFHKMMMASALTTAVLFKESSHSYETFAQKASYILERNNDWFNIAGRTLECTKKGMSIKLFATIKLYGEKLFDEYVTGRFDAAREFAQYIDSQSDFENALEPESNILCFRYVQPDVEDLNKLNAEIRKKVVEDGRFYIVQTIIDDKTYLRLSIMNPFTTLKEFEELLELIRKTAK